MLAFTLSCLAFAVGCVALASDQLHAFPLVIALAYAALSLVGLATLRVWKDPLAPLCLVLAVGFIRFGLPGLLVLAGADPASALFRELGLTPEDWHRGHILALTGLLGTAIGWCLVPSLPGSPMQIKWHLRPGVGYLSPLALVVGVAALYMFVSSNAHVVEAVVGGSFRSAAITEGTGKYFHTSYVISSSSVILSCFWLARIRGSRWLCLLPVVFATALYGILGGRVRAIVPLASGLLLLWYVDREDRVSARCSALRSWTWVCLGVFFLVWFARLGQLYRGGLGTEAFSETLSLSGLWEYGQWTIFGEFGQLQALAAATKLGPGAMEGVAFYALLWPLSALLDLPGKSSGIYIIQSLTTFGSYKWGLHSSLLGDAYLNFGLAGLAIITCLFGMVLKALYAGFRHGTVHSALYVLCLMNGLRVYFESVEKWGEFLLIVASAYLILTAGNLLHPGSRAPSARFAEQP